MRRWWDRFLSVTPQDVGSGSTPVSASCVPAPPCSDGDATLGEVHRLAGGLVLLGAQAVERPGSDEVTDDDRRWFGVVAEAGCLAEVGLRGPMLAHREGVRWIGSDDL